MTSPSQLCGTAKEMLPTPSYSPLEKNISTQLQLHCESYLLVYKRFIIYEKALYQNSKSRTNTYKMEDARLFLGDSFVRGFPGFSYVEHNAVLFILYNKTPVSLLESKMGTRIQFDLIEMFRSLSSSCSDPTFEAIFFVVFVSVCACDCALLQRNIF